MERILRLDYKTLLWFQERYKKTFLTTLWKCVTHTADAGWLWILSILILLVKESTRTVGLTAGISLAITSFSTNFIFKKIFKRTRPYDAEKDVAIIPLIKCPKDLSFPSGHTSAAFSVAIVYLFMLPYVFGVIAVIWAVLTGFSRIYLRVHYPSDVAVGAVFGTFISIICLKILFISSIMA